MGSSNRSRFNLVVRERQCTLIRVRPIQGQLSTGVTERQQEGLRLAQVAPSLPQSPNFQQLAWSKTMGRTTQCPRAWPRWGAAPRRPWPYLPEPLNDRVVRAVAVLVNRMLSPVIHVHVAEAAHQQLERRVTTYKRGRMWTLKTSHTEKRPFLGVSTLPCAMQVSWQLTETNEGSMSSKSDLPPRSQTHVKYWGGPMARACTGHNVSNWRLKLQITLCCPPLIWAQHSQISLCSIYICSSRGCFPFGEVICLNIWNTT